MSLPAGVPQRVEYVRGPPRIVSSFSISYRHSTTSPGPQFKITCRPMSLCGYETVRLLYSQCCWQFLGSEKRIPGHSSLQIPPVIRSNPSRNTVVSVGPSTLLRFGSSTIVQHFCSPGCMDGACGHSGSQNSDGEDNRAYHTSNQSALYW